MKHINEIETKEAGSQDKECPRGENKGEARVGKGKVVNFARFRVRLAGSNSQAGAGNVIPL